MKRLFFYFFFALTLLPFSTMTAQEGRKAETVQSEQSSLTLTVSGTTVRVQNATPGSLMEVYNILFVKFQKHRADN